MSKTSRRSANKPVVELYEKVNIDMLERMLSSKLPQETLQSLSAYHKKIRDGEIPVAYRFAADSMPGTRAYAEKGLGLQSFKRMIRHALAKDIYHDIDIVNAHPHLIMQYCDKHSIPCEELSNYVNNREEVLADVMKHHKIDREQAKKLILRLSYLGAYKLKDKNGNEYVPKPFLKQLEVFSAEMKKIANRVYKIETAVAEHVEKVGKENPKSSALSITIQMIEHKCMMAIRECLTMRKYVVGVLCFDGVMVEKTKPLTTKLDKRLRECERCVLCRTGYVVRLEEKEMNIPFDIALPEYSYFVDSDKAAQEKIFQIEGANKFHYCDKTMFTFDDRIGLYDDDIQTMYYYFAKNEKYLNILNKSGKNNNYGTWATLMKNAVPFMTSAAKDNEWLRATENSSIGYLLFKNGIYDMKRNVFKKGFDPNIVFRARIMRDFPVRKQEEIDYAMSISFDVLFKNPKVMITVLARALAGDACKNFFFCPGASNSGKTCLSKILRVVFGAYVGIFNAESLSCPANDTKDEASKMRWALVLQSCRILVSNEANMNKMLDGSSIKKHSSGGDEIVARDHFKKESSFVPHYTIFCMLNDIPEITNMDEAVHKRLQFIEFPYVFVDEEDVHKKPTYRKKDPDFISKIEESRFINGFMHIIFDAYQDFLKNGMPSFDEVAKDKWTAEARQNVGIIDTIKERYEITNSGKDMVTVSELNKLKPKGISAVKYTEILTDELNLVLYRTANTRYWKGIRAISDD